MRKVIVLLIASALSFTATTMVRAQGQWVEIIQSSDGERVFFDLSSQARQFDTGIKTNAFRTVTTSTEGISLRGAVYNADCFRGTLALRRVEQVSTQGRFIREIPLELTERRPFVPTQGSVGAAVWQYACSQF